MQLRILLIPICVLLFPIGESAEIDPMGSECFLNCASFLNGRANIIHCRGVIFSAEPVGNTYLLGYSVFSGKISSYLLHKDHSDYNRAQNRIFFQNSDNLDIYNLDMDTKKNPGIARKIQNPCHM